MEILRHKTLKNMDETPKQVGIIITTLEAATR